jgi:opacity protein-like surface antigen
MSKLFSVAAVVLVCSAGAANAEPGNFGGFYIGGIVSEAFEGPSSTLFDDHIGAGPDDVVHSGSRNSPTYGVQGGYNYQFDRYVLGIEGDWSWGNGKSETAVLDDGGPGIDSASAELKSLGSVRGRAGIVVLNNLMVFGTAGFGWGNADYGFRDHDAISGTAKYSANATGAVFGGGFDMLLGYNIVLSAEYLRYDFDDNVFIADASKLNGGSDVATKLGPIDTFRVAVSYKFGGEREEPVPLK